MVGISGYICGVTTVPPRVVLCLEEPRVSLNYDRSGAWKELQEEIVRAL